MNKKNIFKTEAVTKKTIMFEFKLPTRVYPGEVMVGNEWSIIQKKNRINHIHYKFSTLNVLDYTKKAAVVKPIRHTCRTKNNQWVQDKATRRWVRKDLGGELLCGSCGSCGRTVPKELVFLS